MVLAHLKHAEYTRHQHHAQGNRAGIHHRRNQDIHACIIIVLDNRRHASIHAQSRHNRNNTGNNKDRHRLLKNTCRQLAQKRQHHRRRKHSIEGVVI